MPSVFCWIVSLLDWTMMAAPAKLRMVRPLMMLLPEPATSTKPVLGQGVAVDDDPGLGRAVDGHLVGDGRQRQRGASA